MKTKKILLVVLMLSTLIGYASDNKKPNAKRTVKVEFKNVKKGHTLTIKNNLGVTLYSNEIKTAGTYSKLFDFSALENGIYSAELNKDFEIIVKNFKVKNGAITFLNNSNKKVFKPIIRTDNDRLYVSKIAFDKEPLNVTIYYNGEIILSETIKDKKILKRVYKLSENKTGNYIAIINTDDRTYIKDFTI